MDGRRAIVRLATIAPLALAAPACGDSPTAATAVDVLSLEGEYVVTLTRAPTPGNSVTTCRSVFLDFAYRYSEWRWRVGDCGDPRVAAFGTGGDLPDIALLSTEPGLFHPLELRGITGDKPRARLTSTWRGLTCRNEIEPGSRFCVLEAGTAVWVRQ